MRQWHKLLNQVLKYGEKREDRTGVGTLSVFGAHSRFDLRDGFPAVTAKKLYFGQVAAELAAFLAGAETLEEFHKFGCMLWDANGLDPRWTEGHTPGWLGRIYGVQWRRWRSVKEGPAGEHLSKITDQIKDLVDRLRGDPWSRRHVVTAWNPGELGEMCLPPCHTFFQCYVSADRQFLDLRFDLRSVDLFVGWPFDVASYALLAHLLARDAGLIARQLCISMGDAHIYNNHLEQVEAVLAREPMELSSLALLEGVGALNFAPAAAALNDYQSYPPVRAKMNV